VITIQIFLPKENHPDGETPGRGESGLKKQEKNLYD
jgi:hypothetical protein